MSNPREHDPDTYLTAALAGRYEIVREIGRGGMATVYLAKDARHERQVALKVLSPELGAVLGAERFLSEIKVTANLQHPNLLPLFDSGEANGLLYYVMPFVEGETLRHRLDRDKQLPVDEAIRIASAIASALDYAHRHGVIHRDLKPENVLLHEGQPVVADFGIALAVSNAGGQRVTQTGLSLGTPQYMSPEQATGDRSIDGRTDIYSLGAITYEMLAGEPPHIGNSAQAIIAKLMTEDPRPLAILRRTVPPHVDAAVHQALEKLPADRFASAKECADALHGNTGAVRASTTTRAFARTETWPRRVLRGIPWILAAAGIAGMSVARWKLANMPAPATTRFKLDFEEGARVSEVLGHPVAISPDGSMLAYVGRTRGVRMVFVRRLDELAAKPLPGSELATNVEFTRDGKFVSFGGDGARIRRMPVIGGTATTFTTYAGGSWRGSAWASDGSLVISSLGTLWRVPTEGATPVALVAPDTAAGEISITNPYVFPDGKTVVFTANNKLQNKESMLSTVPLEGGSRRNLNIAAQNVVGFVDGLLVFGTLDGSLFAVPFDAATGKTGRDPVQVAEGLQARNNSLGVSADLSANGTLVYVRGNNANQLALLDGSGKQVGEITDRLDFAAPTWSPDGSRLAVATGGALSLSSGVWVYDVSSKVFSRLTTQGAAFRPEWSPNGDRVAFITPNSVVRSMPADGSAVDEPFFEMKGRQMREVTFSRDGRFAVLRGDPNIGGTTARDLFLLPLDTERKALPFVQGTANELHPAISPDSRWVAYQSDETGRFEIYLRPLAVTGGRVQVSSGGGTEPRWTADGTRVVYRGATAFWSATLATGATSVAVARRDSLFPDAFERADYSRQNYDISRDGRFAVIRQSAEASDVVVVTNWMTEVRSKLKPNSRRR